IQFKSMRVCALSFLFLLVVSSSCSLYSPPDSVSDPPCWWGAGVGNGIVCHYQPLHRTQPRAKSPHSPTISHFSLLVCSMRLLLSFLHTISCYQLVNEFFCVSEKCVEWE